MNNLKQLLLIGILLSAAAQACSAFATDKVVEFESGTDRVSLLELYSSQGCSSCPPAEKWVNQFTLSDTLWDEQIPIVFHVDYWDYLGWKDPFSDYRFSARQQKFKQQGLSKSVYTPGFILNGREWRGWFKRRDIPAPTGSAGNLKLILDGDSIYGEYSRIESDHVLNIAVLGFGLKTFITSGENRRRTLIQDFVVLNFKQVDVFEDHFLSDWMVPESNAKKLGMVAWITKGESLVPEQATGNWLPEELVQEVSVRF